MRPLAFSAAADVPQALDLLARHGPTARIIAGGTDLLPALHAGARGIEAVVDISRIAALKRIALAEEGLRIGALATHTDIMRSPLVRTHAPALADAAHAIGAVQTRNRGTLGGNLMTCVPSMDSGPLLLALDARAIVAGQGGTRELDLAELFVGPRKTALGFDEILVALCIPRRNLGKPAAFLKAGLRKGQALALVNVAACLWRDADGALRDPAIALGAVAPTVFRAREAEASLRSVAPSAEAFAAAGRLAAAEAKPISDFRASADYRRELIAVLTARALAAAWRRAGGEEGDR
ncbi:MAG: FAD binding domain-containing protein [Variibacter sp.]|nr:FAD binding domain-containing protein [Variibacter sp.]